MATVGKTLKGAARTVRSAAKKAARQIDKAVVEPVADLFRSGTKGRKKPAKARTARGKAARVRK